MKIYFAGSIRGGRDDIDLYVEIIKYLKNYGEVLTEHISDKKLTSLGEGLDDRVIHDRDLKWVFSSDVVVAEVTSPSLGIGYEIGRALEKGIKVLCLYRTQEGKRLSAMIAGCPNLVLKQYKTIDEVKKIIDNYFK